MGFRGALLERRRDAGPGFRAVAASCELVLVIERIAPSEIDASGTVDAKALFQDPATKQLLSIARLADVTLEAGAVFWHADEAAVHCFRFDAAFAFAEVQRAVASIRRQEQLALVQHSLDAKHYATCANIMTSIVATEDRKEKNAIKRVRDEPVRARKKQPRHDASSDNRTFNLQWIGSAKPASANDARSVCHLCHLAHDRMFHCPNGEARHTYCANCVRKHFGQDETEFLSGAIRYHCRLCAHACSCEACQLPPQLPTCVVCTSKDDVAPHPSVLQNTRGQPLSLCASCLETLRASQEGSVPFCTLCGGLDDTELRCSTCKREFCDPCQDLMGTSLCAAKTKWQCASCVLPSFASIAIQPKAKAMGIVLVDPNDALTYTVSYAQMLVQREANKVPAKISEDSCFCCKDGGVLIECDHIAAIPDKGLWRCPRHFCFKCSAPTTHCCRFCVAAYCEKHVPRAAVMLGPAPSDLPDTTYIACRPCIEQLDEAAARGLLPSGFYKAIM
ncbi:hypothetical protein SPRG_07988 [Saprolegnia parasitica CBS 223.65]|uniref:Uncharacterized protein n=1 Tax=Saprolegnia parasitica (strain CBS 223.65) TaxID=695850 RepID=A0A067C738_SAPPC|nr:hypothetical protein SPRG_07988 [Saprolegnia parasitica CBS 223.65]KDO26584.1 hypothetical protein SPRG_07988 [Saprolegnia parasitica CBS 223.65]|eukprot:XP_012202726.1 hypothetical protein SPRG_07988 [Saprolegnia parasitica CBS 223.65]